MSDIKQPFDESASPINRSDDGVEIETFEAPGVVGYSMKPKKFENFKLFVDDIHGPTTDESAVDFIGRVESELGFKFPQAIPFIKNGYSKGFEFEGKPNLKLPDGWDMKFKDIENSSYLDIIDDKGRWRGDYDTQMKNDLNDRAFIRLFPRFVFDANIVASIHKEWPNEYGYTTSASYPYWMSSISTGFKEAIPCFIYANPSFWPIEKADCDYTRLGKELDAIEEADKFIARHTKGIFEGAAIKRGTQQEIITDGRESMAMGIDIPGDVFAHWDDESEKIPQKISELRQLLEEEVPKILGEDNSLVLATFPTDEEIENIKTNTPYYNPPPPQQWQKAVTNAEARISKAAKAVLNVFKYNGA